MASGAWRATNTQRYTHCVCGLLLLVYSVQFSHWVMSNSLWPYGLQHTKLPCPSPTPIARSNSCPSSRWYHPTISLSAVLLSSCLYSFPVSGSLLISQFFTSGNQSIGTSPCISPSNEYSRLISFRIDLFDLLAVQGTLRVFSNTTVQKHQFFRAQLSLWSNTYIHTWQLEKNRALTIWTFVSKVIFSIRSLGLSRSFSCGSDGNEFACNAGDPSLISGSERSLGEGKSDPLQYSYLKNFRDKGV